MIKFVVALGRLAVRPALLRRRLFPTRQERIRDQWRKFNRSHPVGRKLDYPLTANSLVMEVGSFDGLWARDVHQRYGSRILIFEPVESFCRKMRGSIPTVGGGGGRAVEILPYGLSDHDHEDFFYLQGQGTSFNRRLADAQQVKVQLRDGVKVLDELNITNVDLVKINIEGGEYDLLEHYIEYERLSVFKNLLIQFHRIQGAEERLTTLRERMAETHELSWRYEGVFESWRRRDA